MNLIMMITRTGVFSVIFVVIPLYCGIDPFRQSAISSFPDFKAYRVDFSLWSLLPFEKDVHNLLEKSEIRFRNELQGPESITFDLLGRGPYTGVADGRILFWNGHSWTTFAYASPNWSEICDWRASSLSYLKNEHICGRPLGIRFNKKTGELYIADAYFGILKVGPQGGLATPITTEVQGVPFKFISDLDIDEYGNVYFTDSSTIYQRRDFMQLTFAGENSGRVLKYNPETEETTVLARNLQYPIGVSVSKDGSFFVFCEGSLGRLSKYWLKGEKAGTSEVLAILHGFPENVRTNENGELWVAINYRRSIYAHLSGLHPKIREFMLKLPIPASFHYLLHIGGWPHGIVVKYSPDGKILKILEDKRGKFVKSVTEVAEIDGKLWIGSLLMPSVAVYSLDGSK